MLNVVQRVRAALRTLCRATSQREHVEPTADDDRDDGDRHARDVALVDPALPAVADAGHEGQHHDGDDAASRRPRRRERVFSIMLARVERDTVRRAHDPRKC